MISTPYREQERYYPWGIFHSQDGNFGSCESEHRYKIYISQNVTHAVRVGAPIQRFLIMIPLTIDFKVLPVTVLRCPVSSTHHMCYVPKALMCNVSNRDKPLPPFFFLKSLLRMASLESSVSQAAKCIGEQEQEQDNLELMSSLQGHATELTVQFITA